MYLSCVLSLVDYEKKSGSLKTRLVSHRNTTESTSYVHFRAWKNLKCPQTKCTSMLLGAASYFRVGAAIAAQTHPYLRGTQSSQFTGASPVRTVIIKTSTREKKKNRFYEKRQEALLATALPWTPPTFSFQVDLWGVSSTPSTHHEASALSRFIVPIRDVHTFGPWSEYTKLNHHLFLDLFWRLQWNKIIWIRKKIKIDPYLASAIGSLSFSSADPRVLKSGDVNTWQCFSIHSAGNASSVIVVLLEVVVMVEGGVTLFFF